MTSEREGRAARAVHPQDDGADRGVAPALLQRRDQRVRARRTSPRPNGSSWLGPSTIVPSTEQHGDAAAGPGAGRERRRIGIAHADDPGGRARARATAPARPRSATASTSPASAAPRRREDAAVDERAHLRGVHRVARPGAVARRSPPTTRPNTSSSSWFLLARTSGDCSVMMNGSIAPLNSPMRTRSTWTPRRSIARLVEGHVLGDAGQRQLARRVQHDGVAGGGQVVLARRRERRVGEGRACRARAGAPPDRAAPRCGRSRGRASSILSSTPDGGRIDRQRAQPAHQLQEGAIVVDAFSTLTRARRRRARTSGRPRARSRDVQAARDAGPARAARRERAADARHHAARWSKSIASPNAEPAVAAALESASAVPRGTLSPSA